MSLVSFILLQAVSSAGLVLAEISCPGGVQPICPPMNPGPSMPGMGIVTDNSTVSCPQSCDPHANSCDPTTAPSCTYADPRVSQPLAACACRPGYKASGYADTDAAKQWRLPVSGQDHRVWVAEGVKCDTLCDVPHGVGSCREVTLLPAQCAGSGQGQGSMPMPPAQGLPSENTNSYSMPNVVKLETTPEKTTYLVQDNEIFGNKTLVYPFVHPNNATLGRIANSSDGMIDQIVDSIAEALPAYLSQQGMVEEDIPAFVNNSVSTFASAAILMFNPANDADAVLPPAASDEAHQLARRKKGKGFFGKTGIKIPPITEITGHVIDEGNRQIQGGIRQLGENIGELGRTDQVCSTFAYGALSGYMTESNAVAARKPGPGLGITRDQMYFLYPVYGSYPQDENLKGHYGLARTAVESYAAITFNRDMYFVEEVSPFGRPWADSAAFRSVTGTLVHEVRHTQQYRDLGFSQTAFGMKYLFQFCKAGWSYNQIDFERDARSYQGLVDGLLQYELGYSFFEYWRYKDLYSTLGYPSEKAIVPSTGPSATVGHYELSFQNGGVLQGINYADCSRCFRVIDRTMLAYRTLSDACALRQTSYSYCEEFQRIWREQQPQFECVEELRRTLVGDKCV